MTSPWLTSNPIPVTLSSGGSSTPADYSANTAAAITAAQATTLLVTIPATASRSYVEVQNQSAATVSVVRDDGSATAGTVSLILLAGSGAGAQGGGWSSTTFRGRVLVYGASGAQVSAYQE